MAKGGNSLQAVLNRAKADGDAAPAPAPAIEPVDVSRKAPPSGRQGTKLIGGHFPPEVSTQLRIIAAEEGTTVQSLLGEALDDLFVKKRSEEHTSELQSLMRSSYAVFCLKKKNNRKSYN